ncbi:MAG: hypothetical protein ACJ8DQ_03015 [Xanthobacteraceae bacterium]|jgi:hypothetical protein
MKSGESSSEWTIPEVLARLRESGKGKPVQAHVFLSDDVPAEQLPDLARQMITAAKKKVGEHAAAELGKIHGLAKSFSLKADVDTLSAVAKMPNIKAILPSEVEDVFPRPVKASPVND